MKITVDTENYGEVTMEEYFSSDEISVLFTLQKGRTFEIVGYSVNDLTDETFIDDVFGCESIDQLIENSLPRRTEKKQYSNY